jgi:hypothetical protein
LAKQPFTRRRSLSEQRLSVDKFWQHKQLLATRNFHDSGAGHIDFDVQHHHECKLAELGYEPREAAR